MSIHSHTYPVISAAAGVVLLVVTLSSMRLSELTMLITLGVAVLLRIPAAPSTASSFSRMVTTHLVSAITCKNTGGSITDNNSWGGGILVSTEHSKRYAHTRSTGNASHFQGADRKF